MYGLFFIAHILILFLPIIQILDAQTEGLEDSALILLQTFLGFAYALGCIGFGLIVVRQSAQCMISRQYLCQASMYGLGECWERGTIRFIHNNFEDETFPFPIRRVSLASPQAIYNSLPWQDAGEYRLLEKVKFYWWFIRETETITKKLKILGKVKFYWITD